MPYNYQFDMWLQSKLNYIIYNYDIIDIINKSL